MNERSDKVFATEGGAIHEAERSGKTAWRARHAWRTIYICAKSWRAAASLAFEAFGGDLEPLPNQRTLTDVMLDDAVRLRDEQPEEFAKLLLLLEQMPKPRKPLNPEDYMNS